MGLYLPVQAKGSAAIAICRRCGFKVHYDELRLDPNNKNWYCKGCIDIYDPWRLPARTPENISLDHPRRDEDIA